MKIIKNIFLVLGLFVLVSCTSDVPTIASEDDISNMIIGKWEQSDTETKDEKKGYYRRQLNRKIQFFPDGTYTATRNAEFKGPPLGVYKGGQKEFTFNIKGKWDASDNKIKFTEIDNTIEAIKSDKESLYLAQYWNESYRQFSFTEYVFSIGENKFALYSKKNKSDIMTFTRLH